MDNFYDNKRRHNSDSDRDHDLPPKRAKLANPSAHIFDTINETIAELMPIYQQKLYAKCGDALFFDYNVSIYDGDENNAQYDFMLTQGDNTAVVGCETSLIMGTASQPSELTFTLDSATDGELRGRKYNLFLRAFIIHMACVVQRHDSSITVSVISQAVNPVSLYTLAKYFTIEVFDIIGYKIDVNTLESFQMYLDAHRPPIFADIKRMYDDAIAASGNDDEDISVMIMIDCNETNNNNAAHLMDTLLLSNGGLVCSGAGASASAGAGAGGGRCRRKRSCKRRRRRHGHSCRKSKRRSHYYA